jgi:hypothetical protein
VTMLRANAQCCWRFRETAGRTKRSGVVRHAAREACPPVGMARRGSGCGEEAQRQGARRAPRSGAAPCPSSRLRWWQHEERRSGGSDACRRCALLLVLSTSWTAGWAGWALAPGGLGGVPPGSLRPSRGRMVGVARDEAGLRGFPWGVRRAEREEESRPHPEGRPREGRSSSGLAARRARRSSADGPVVSVKTPATDLPQARRQGGREAGVGAPEKI